MAKIIDSSMSIIPIILLFLLILILLYVKYLNDRREYIESFTNQETVDNETHNETNNETDNKIYLYPTRDLGDECAKEGLKPAFAPTICQIGDTMTPYANCKCIDDNGHCKTCYDPIKKDMTNANIVYDAYPNATSALTQIIHNS